MRLLQDSSHLGHSRFDMRHLVGASGDHLELLVHDLAVGECQIFTDLSNCGLQIECLAGHGCIWIVLRDVEGDPFTSLLLVEGVNG